MAGDDNTPRKALIIESSKLGTVKIPARSDQEFDADLDGLEGLLFSEILSAFRLWCKGDEGEFHEPDSAEVEDEAGSPHRGIYVSLMFIMKSDHNFDERLWFDLLADGNLGVELSVDLPLVRDRDTAHGVLEMLASRAGFVLTEVEYSTDTDDDYWNVKLCPGRLSLSVADLVSLKSVATHILRIPALAGGGGRGGVPRLGWELARDILIAGHPRFLLGQDESSWLEVKSQGYETGPAGEIELAQDVARFANGDEAGIIALGYREKRRGGRSVVEKVVPQPFKIGLDAIYHKAIDRRVFPAIRGLQVERIEVDGGAIIMLVIPRQREEDKPFLVTGAMVEGKCEGAFISIVRRRGEHSIPITPAAIHATLAAGRAALRGSHGVEPVE